MTAPDEPTTYEPTETRTVLLCGNGESETYVPLARKEGDDV